MPTTRATWSTFSWDEMTFLLDTRALPPMTPLVVHVNSTVGSVDTPSVDLTAAEPAQDDFSVPRAILRRPDQVATGLLPRRRRQTQVQHAWMHPRSTRECAKATAAACGVDIPAAAMVPKEAGYVEPMAVASGALFLDATNVHAPLPKFVGPRGTLGCHLPPKGCTMMLGGGELPTELVPRTMCIRHSR
ncbi:hypothetical protein H310_09857 [Aphanomyces invadans]|uniref:Uncharacterized protein n=1 Tax=Aphanomyces invadans TaxID=157072 RepID=A0A024TUL8_9STRA|nr:hypothetical protein H310_09857 [Aphanomyces invadans]ETV97022.1 hypothetical protein H310_09857 [Aphanomyces invadans]|eukprot:XP_008874268.1 hypothetical protein H310_09857 [Aphanomyces invadans]